MKMWWIKFFFLFPKDLLGEEAATFFYFSSSSHMNLTALACSSLAAMYTTQGNKLMSKDLWEVGLRAAVWGGTNSSLHLFLVVVHIIIVCRFINQSCLVTRPRIVSALSSWPNPPLRTLLWLRHTDDNKVLLASDLFCPFLCEAVVFLFHYCKYK